MHARIVLRLLCLHALALYVSMYSVWSHFSVAVTKFTVFLSLSALMVYVISVSLDALWARISGT